MELFFKLGDIEGFTSNKTADRKSGYATPIRELLQNSLDASQKNNCQVDIHINTINKSDIPCIDQYEAVLRKAVKSLQDRNSYNENQKQIVERIQGSLAKDSVEVLMFRDYGSGMSPKRIDSLLSGRSHNKGEETTGSYGVGHLSAHWLSGLRYVLYATEYEDKVTRQIKKLFTGSPIIAGYQDTDKKQSQRGGQGRIVELKPKNEHNPDFKYPSKFPSFINKIWNAGGGGAQTHSETTGHKVPTTGTMVVIVDLTESWNEDAEYAIASNFFHAIYHNQLRVRIYREDVDPKIIDQEAISQILEHRNEITQAREGCILSGRDIFQCWQALESKPHEISLSNKETVAVRIKQGISMHPTIALVRNGMLIARHDSMLSRKIDNLRKDPDFEPFTVIIEVNPDQREIFSLIKNAEGPHHNQLDKGRLTEDKEKRLKKLFTELSGNIKEQLKIIVRDSFNLSLFAISENDAAIAGSTSTLTPRGQTPQARTQNVQDRHQPLIWSPITTHQNRPPPRNPGRNLIPQIATRYTSKDDQYLVDIRLKPAHIAKQDSVYFSMRVAHDNDNTQGSSIYLNLIEVTLNNEKLELPEDASYPVLLGHLASDMTYHLSVKAQTPDLVKDLTVGLEPIFTLRRIPIKQTDE